MRLTHAICICSVLYFTQYGMAAAQEAAAPLPLPAPMAERICEDAITQAMQYEVERLEKLAGKEREARLLEVAKTLAASPHIHQQLVCLMGK